MTTRDQLQAAKRLIQMKQYRKARRALKQIDHPTARKWETQLDAIAPASRRPSAGVILGYIAFTLVGCALVLWALGWGYVRSDGYQAMMGDLSLALYCDLKGVDTAAAAACRATVDTFDPAAVAACNRGADPDNAHDVIDQAWIVALCVQRETGTDF